MDYSSLYNKLDANNYHTSNHSANELVFLPMLRKVHVQTVSRQRVLDIGCGTCAALPSFQTVYEGGAYGLEVSPRAVRLARTLGRARGCNEPPCLVSGSILNIPWKNMTFDAIVSSDVFEHIVPADVPMAVSETRRVLAPGGILLVSIATGSSKRLGIELHATQRPMAWWEHAFAPLVPIPLSSDVWRALWSVPTTRWNWRNSICDSPRKVACGNVFLAFTDSHQNATRLSLTMNARIANKPISDRP